MTIEVTPRAIVAARDSGIYGKIDARVRRMASRSTLAKSPWGNRQFGNFILKIEDGRVLDIARLENPDVGLRDRGP